MIIFRDGNISDLNDLIRLHQRSEVEGILSKLTPKILKELYYLPILQNECNIIKVAFDNESKKVVGLLIIDHFSSTLPKLNLKLSFKLTINLFFKSVLEPTLIVRILNYFRCKNFLKKMSVQGEQEMFELQMLIIDRTYQSQGIGHQLLKILDNPILSNSFILVQTQNNKAREFYGKFGFQVTQSFGTLKTSLWLLTRKKTRTNVF